MPTNGRQLAQGRLWNAARTAAVAFCGAAALTALSTAFVFPAAAAIACPQCYGFDELALGARVTAASGKDRA
ncbi:MAG TPA: hypothetical protein VKV96_03900 [Roseiarcus sp.]|nr:hypothetical protein [Roseiarcus sp.]